MFNPLSYSFEETIGFDVKAPFVSLPESRLIWWHNKRILIEGYSVPTGHFMDWKLQTELKWNET